jgi:hypothetical protein
LHETHPGSKKLVYVHPKNGKFNVDTESGVKEYESLEGTLDLVRIEYDEGNPKNKILPYDALIMHISDDEFLYRIKINIDRNFSFSVGKVLEDLQKGDRIIARTKAGTDPTVTFCNILKRDESGQWVRPKAVELPAEKPEKIAYLRRAVESHSAYTPKPEPVAK